MFTLSEGQLWRVRSRPVASQRGQPEFDEDELVRLLAVTERRPPHERVSLDHTARSGVRFVTTRDGKSISGLMTYVDGELLLVSLTVSHPEGVTTSLLRGVHLVELVAEVRAKVILQGFGTYVYVNSGKPVLSEAERRRSRELADSAAGSRLKKGRHRLGEDHYRRIASAYLDHVIEGHTGGVLKSIAAAEGARLGREVPVATVRTWVAVARKLGFLAPGHPGRRTTEPGPNLYQTRD